MKIKGHLKHFNCLAVSPDGRRLVAGFQDNTIQMWDANSGKELALLEGHDGEITSVAFSPNGKEVVSGSADSTIRIWNVNTGKSVATFIGHDQFGVVASFDTTGTRIVSTYVGGSFSENELSGTIAVDTAGNAYITGDTSLADFPTVNPLQSSAGGGMDAFVTKLNASGSALVYSTYLGGSDDDIGLKIAVDTSGSAYVAGTTASLILGGSRDDAGIAIAIDGGRNVYVAGATTSSDFPMKNPLQPTFGGGADWVL